MILCQNHIKKALSEYFKKGDRKKIYQNKNSNLQKYKSTTLINF